MTNREDGNSTIVSKLEGLHFEETLVFDSNSARARKQFSMTSDKNDISYVFWYVTRNDGDSADY